MSTTFIPIRSCINSEKYRKAIINPSVPLVISTGPAGTGKSLKACTYAAELMRNEKNKYKAVYLTRPFVSVEGEDLGFLPGTLEEKMNPWMNHLISFCHLIPNRNVQLTTLGHMRGVTYQDCIIIADEMQNSTPTQMKTLLTRMGENSKVIVIGDISQCDLKGVDKNGLMDLLDRIDSSSPMVESIKFTVDEVKRSEFVKYILNMYHSPNSLSKVGYANENKESQ